MSDTVRVDLGDDYYTGEYYREADNGAYEIPREQFDRWETIKDAYEAMQEEIAEITRSTHFKPQAAPTGLIGGPLAEAYSAMIKDQIEGAALFRSLLGGKQP